MLLTLVFLLFSCGLVPYLAYKYDNESIVGWAILANLFIAIIVIAILSVSYGSYIDMKQYAASFNTHADTIASYEKIAVLDTTKSNPSLVAALQTSALTDLKYQNYQKGVKELVEGLKKSCIEYNDILTTKNIIGNNIIFSWLIIMPDDGMTVVKFSDFLDVSNR